MANPNVINAGINALFLSKIHTIVRDTCPRVSPHFSPKVEQILKISGLTNNRTVWVMRYNDATKISVSLMVSWELVSYKTIGRREKANPATKVRRTDDM